jgi:hypothetical protein
MLFLALIFGLFFFSGQAVFDAGGSVPQSGLSDVLQSPKTPAPASRARLTIKHAGIVTIFAGSGFKPNELVRLTGSVTRRVQASSRGAFVVRTRTTDPCADLSLTAVGSKGSRTSIQISQLHCVDQ